jgi:polyisoprenoid-binding protein YceI
VWAPTVSTAYKQSNGARDVASVIKTEQQTMSTVSSSTAIPAGTWMVDPARARLGFAVNHIGLATVRGALAGFDGTIEIGEDLSTAKAYGTVTVESLDADQPQGDQHLHSPDFFDAGQYPLLRFESTKIEAPDDAEYRITGKLTIHGVTNEIVLHAEVQGTDLDLWDNDYGMTFNQALGSGNVLVGDRVNPHSTSRDQAAMTQPPAGSRRDTSTSCAPHGEAKRRGWRRRTDSVPDLVCCGVWR